MGTALEKMTPAIAPGDLVAVVSWPCCGVYLGRIFTVQSLDDGDWTLSCDRCKAFHSRPGVCVESNLENGNLVWAPRSWLKKIDPPALPETVERTEEITA